MSVQEIEIAIEKLKPSEKEELAEWISAHCPPVHTQRPRFQEAVFTPVKCSADAFSPLNEDELADFGLS